MVQNEIIKQAIANMILLEIPMEYIRDFKSNGKTYLIDGRTATEINPMTYPKLNDFVESVKERNGTVVYGVFNEPNMYGEKTDKYILLCLDKSAIKSPLYQIRQKGQIYTTVAYGWCESTGIAEPTVVCFQVSNGGIWCLPHPIAQMVSRNVMQEKDDDIFLRVVEKLDLSVREFNLLKRAGIHTVKDLIDYTEGNKPRCVHNIDRKSLEEVIQKLLAHLGLETKSE